MKFQDEIYKLGGVGGRKEGDKGEKIELFFEKVSFRDTLYFRGHFF